MCVTIFNLKSVVIAIQFDLNKSNNSHNVTPTYMYYVTSVYAIRRVDWDNNAQVSRVYYVEIMK